MDNTSNTTSNAQEPTIKPIYAPVVEGQGEGSTKALDANETDYTDFLREAKAANKANGGKYLLSRGISLETQERFGVGYVPNWKHPKAPKAPASPRCIIPTSSTSYLARATDPKTPKEYTKQKAGKAHIFNLEAFTRAAEKGQPVFVVEGEIDAMSIEELGGHATALGSVAYVGRFLQDLELKIASYPSVIIALDNDNAGKAAINKLGEGLAKLGYLSVVAGNMEHQGKTYKDANDFLVNCPEGLNAWISEGFSRVNLAKEVEVDNYATDFYKAFDGFIRGTHEKRIANAIPTGYGRLDTILGGGLLPGLIVVGAIPSLGKSTMVLQLADYIAASGKDVLFFALEMSATELIAKSLSRMTAQGAKRERYALGNARTALEMMKRSQWNTYGSKTQQLIAKAIQDYADNQRKHLFIFEGVGDIGINDIKAAVARHKRATGRTPAVVVDYLQIMKLDDSKGLTDKQMLDTNVLALKRLSRDENTPVVAVSSFNRQAYDKEVGFSAFKESGALEYTADVLLGLQIKGTGTKDFDEAKAKAAKARKVDGQGVEVPSFANGINERLIELSIMKNRNGEVGAMIDYKYYPAYNYFVEQEEDNTPDQSPF